MKAIYLSLCFIVAAISCWLMVACDGNVHDGEIPYAEGEGALTVGFKMGQASIGKVALACFNAEEQAVAIQCFDTPKQLANHIQNLPQGVYTVVIAANINDAIWNLLSAMELGGVSDWLELLEEQRKQYPSLKMDCVMQVEVKAYELSRVHVSPVRKLADLALPQLTVRFKWPEVLDGTNPDAQAEDYLCRAIVELYLKGTQTLVHRKVFTPELNSNGYGEVLLTVNHNVYDVLLWADYASATSPKSDLYYVTSQGLDEVSVNPDDYRIGSDQKDASYCCWEAVDCTESNLKTITGNLQRASAKYELITNDLMRYQQKVAEGTCPPIEDLTVEISHNGFMATALNVATGLLTDAIGGIAYQQALTKEMEGEKEVVIGSDWLLASVHGTQLQLVVTVRDKAGNIVSRTPKINLSFQPNQRIEIRSNFLTAGQDGGIDINTDWDDEEVIEF